MTSSSPTSLGIVDLITVSFRAIVHKNFGTFSKKTYFCTYSRDVVEPFYRNRSM
jgi:hypothetical protein